MGNSYNSFARYTTYPAHLPNQPNLSCYLPCNCPIVNRQIAAFHDPSSTPEAPLNEP